MKHTHRNTALLESRLRTKDREMRDTDRKYRALQDELERTQRALSQALEVVKRPPRVHTIAPTPRTNVGEGTAVVLASDWHLDEMVDQSKVNGLNKYNPEIAKKRAERMFDLAIRFLRVERQESRVERMILWLGGDFFTSSESHGTPVAMPTMEAVRFAEDVIYSGIKFILEQEPNLKLHIVCSVGNHSRLEKTRPVNIAEEQHLSLEWIIYHSLRQKLPETITWDIPNSYFAYVKVYEQTLRFCHGHLGFRYNDALSGIHGGLWKAITQRWNRQVFAHHTSIGHWHQWIPSSRARGYTVNGSLIGTTAYGMQFGHEDPSQAFYLVHSKYGIVGQRPLLVGG